MAMCLYVYGKEVSGLVSRTKESVLILAWSLYPGEALRARHQELEILFGGNSTSRVFKCLDSGM